MTSTNGRWVVVNNRALFSIITIALFALGTCANANTLEDLPADGFVSATECGVAFDAKDKLASRKIKICSEGARQSSLSLALASDFLKGRRVYVDFDARVEKAALSNIGVLITAYSADNNVISHVGAMYVVTEAQMSVSAFIPLETTSLYISIQSYQTSAILHIDSLRLRRSTRTFSVGEMCKECESKLSGALETIDNKFVGRASIDLEPLKKSAYLSATGSRSSDEVSSSIKELLRKINDSHSRYLDSFEVKALTGLSAKGITVTTPQSAIAKSLIAQEVGYLRLSSYAGADFSARKAYAVALRSAIDELRSQGARKWVIDLRDHGGGSSPPLVAAFRPLLGDGDIGFTVNRLGVKEPLLYGSSRESSIGAEIYFSRDKPSDDSQDSVVVLVGPRTASSAETLTVAFLGRPATLVVGQPTAGFTTTVYDRLLKDGSAVNIATANLADRRGTVVKGSITPEQMLRLDNKPLTALPQEQLNAVLAFLGPRVEHQTPLAPTDARKLDSTDKDK
jgi:C-terminal processing protease CtpA/Prc